METEKLKQQIGEKLKEIEEMIIKGDDKEEIEEQRKKLDRMLEEYIKNI